MRGARTRTAQLEASVRFDVGQMLCPYSSSIPMEGIGEDICANAIPFAFIADDVLVVIALPYGGSGGVEQGIDFSGGDGFEILNDRAHRTGTSANWAGCW